MRTCLQMVLGADMTRDHCVDGFLLNDFRPPEAFQEEAEELGSPSLVLSSPRSS